MRTVDPFTPGPGAADTRCAPPPVQCRGAAPHDRLPVMGSPFKRRPVPTRDLGQGSSLKPRLGVQGTGTRQVGAGPSPSSPRDRQDVPVHYFWGIPFCPAGLQPDQYTGVILCQLQAYERCLKRAQSRSLRKAQFGPPVLPPPGAVQRPRPHPEQGEDPASRDWQADGSAAASAVEEASRESSDRPDTASDQPQFSNVCAEETPEDEGGGNSEEESEDSRGTGSCASPHVCPQDVMLFVGTETQQNLPEEMHPKCEAPQGSDSDSAQEPEDVVLIEDEAEEFQPTPSKKSYVECPICGQKFPSEKIEMHAADCNGTCDGGSQLQVQTRSHTRRVVKQNGTEGSKPCTLTL
ncbi:BRCA1-A complex subunit RAP80 [Pristis pectinata]|uniref:BRCA1-A complex subunit RAP80 n=1 Tax=Pristis pectinata TaxID=685728 RepID=UPI00223D3101|nr:BRCA1-A complex subunit RAP80 [Pristis pectinata]